jgi:hypothetical protein
MTKRAPRGEWALYAWTRDLKASKKNLPAEVDGYPVMIRDVARPRVGLRAKKEAKP